MKRSPCPAFPVKTGLFLGLLLLCASACSMIPESHERDYERLDKIIRLYNNEFESKSDAAGSMWVKNEMKAEYLTKVKELYDRINFVSSQTISIVFKNKGKMIVQSNTSPGGDFDEAIVSNRYEYILAPSVSLKTKIIKQHWALQPNGVWNLAPDLSPFYD